MKQHRKHVVISFSSHKHAIGWYVLNEHSSTYLYCSSTSNLSSCVSTDNTATRQWQSSNGWRRVGCTEVKLHSPGGTFSGHTQSGPHRRYGLRRVRHQKLRSYSAITECFGPGYNYQLLNVVYKLSSQTSIFV